MKNSLYLFSLLFLLLAMHSNQAKAQYCDSLVPYFSIDLSSKADSVWLSPMLYRSGNCCGTVSPDVCVQFDVTIAPDAIGVIVNVYAGSVMGATYVNFNCSGLTSLGDTIFFPGTGPYTLTYCKPGNNLYGYSIESVPAPLGISEYEKSGLIIYPNPADEFIFINSEYTILNYRLFDVSGKIIQSGIMNDNKKIEFASVPSGIYFIEFNSDQGTIIKKLIRK